MRDRLRAVEFPSDIIDQIGGWLTHGVGQADGKGHPITIIGKWLSQVAIVDGLPKPNIISDIDLQTMRIEIVFI